MIESETWFNEQWNEAIEKAKATGEPVTIYKQDHMLGKPYPVARTRHPLFMGANPVKHDPERDNV